MYLTYILWKPTTYHDHLAHQSAPIQNTWASTSLTFYILICKFLSILFQFKKLSAHKSFDKLDLEWKDLIYNKRSYLCYRISQNLLPYANVTGDLFISNVTIHAPPVYCEQIFFLWQPNNNISHDTSVANENCTCGILCSTNALLYAWI